MPITAKTKAMKMYEYRNYFLYGNISLYTSSLHYMYLYIYTYMLRIG